MEGGRAIGHHNQRIGIDGVRQPAPKAVKNMNTGSV